MRTITLAFCALAISGCATVEPYAAPTSSFDASEVAWFKTPGTNTIIGNAVLRTISGEPRTCAGLEANLVPVSRYATERFMAMYGNTERGYLRASTARNFESTDPAYVAHSRQTRCDAQGNFTFENVPDGDYFVTAVVVWGVPQRYFTSTEGGVVMERVTVKGGETKRLVLTN